MPIESVQLYKGLDILLFEWLSLEDNMFFGKGRSAIRLKNILVIASSPKPIKKPMNYAVFIKEMLERISIQVRD